MLSGTSRVDYLTMNRSYADYTFQFLSSSESSYSAALDKDTVVLYTGNQTRAIWALRRGRQNFSVVHKDLATKMVRACEVINGFMSRNISLVERTGMTNRGSAALYNDPYPPASTAARTGVRRRQEDGDDVVAKRVHYPENELTDNVLTYANPPRDRLVPDLDLVTACVPHSERHVTTVWAIYEQYVECTSCPLQRISPLVTSRPIDHIDASIRKLFGLRSAQELDSEKNVVDRQRHRALTSHILQYILEDQMRIVGLETARSYAAQSPHVYITDISVDRPTNKHPDAFALAILFNLMNGDDVYSHAFCQLQSQMMPKSALLTVLQHSSVTALFQSLVGKPLEEAWNRYIAILDVFTDRRQPDMLKQAPIDASSLTMFHVEPYDDEGMIHTYVVPVAYKHPENGFTIRLNELMSSGCVIRWSSISENPPRRDFYKDARVRALLVREGQCTYVDEQAVRALAYEGNVKVEIVLAWMLMPENYQRYLKPELAQFPEGFDKPFDDGYHLDEMAREQVIEVVLKCMLDSQDSIREIRRLDDGRVIVYGMTNQKFSVVPHLQNDPLTGVLQTMHEVTTLLAPSNFPLLRHLFAWINCITHPQADVEQAFDILSENFFVDAACRPVFALLSQLIRLYFDKRPAYDAISTTYNNFWKEHMYSSEDTIGDVLLSSALQTPPPSAHKMWSKKHMPLVRCLADSMLLLERESGKLVWRWRNMTDFEPTEGDGILSLLLKSEDSIHHPDRVIQQLSKDPDMCVHVLHQAVKNRLTNQQAIRDMVYTELPHLIHIYGVRFEDSDSVPIMLTTKKGKEIARSMCNRLVNKIFLSRSEPYNIQHDKKTVFNFGDLTYRTEEKEKGQFKYVRNRMNVVGYTFDGDEQCLVMVCSHFREKVDWLEFDLFLYCFFISHAPIAFVVTSPDDGEDLLRITLVFCTLEQLLLPKASMRQHILRLCADMDCHSMEVLHALLPPADQSLLSNHFSIQIRDWVEGAHMHESAYRQVMATFTTAVYLFDVTHLNHHFSLSPCPPRNTFPIRINNYLSWHELQAAGGKYTEARNPDYAVYGGFKASTFKILIQGMGTNNT